MQETKKPRTKVLVPTLDVGLLNRDLLAEIARPGIQGWARKEIDSFLVAAYKMSCNPLQSLRRLLPEWDWKISEVSWETPEDYEAAVYCFGAWYSQAQGEQVLAVRWTVSTADQKVFWVTATRKIDSLGFAAKTASGSWRILNFCTTVWEENGWNYQQWPESHVCTGREPVYFAPFEGAIPSGTIPVPVGQFGEIVSWGDDMILGHPGAMGYCISYMMPDGTVVTQKVTTNEW